MANSQDSKSLLDISSLKSLKDLRLAVVYTEWNESIVAEQLNGFNKIVSALNIKVTDEVIVPGCVEIPFACKQIWDTHKKRYYFPEAIVAFGAVIQGGTPHFDYVCKSVTEGITQLNILLPIPTIFGILTLNNEAQAWERLGGIHGHKGEEAAITACKMIAMNRKLHQ